MFLLMLILLPVYTGIFYHFVLHYYWAIPINILIAIVLDILTIVLVLVLALPIVKVQKIDNKFKYYYVRSILRFALKMIRVKCSYEGLENLPKDTPYVLFPNHKSYVDVLVLYVMANRPITFISKPENFKIPLVGLYMKYIGCIGLNRNDDREAAKAIIQGIKVVKAGEPIIIFPEGGIKSRIDEKMIDIKAGAYKLATKPMAPVVPVTLIGMTKIKDNAPFKKTKVKCIIHQPINYEEYKDLNTHELGQKVFDIVNSKIE